jgi:hypothetical protein
LVFSFLMLLVLILTSCNNNMNKGDNPLSVKGVDYNNVIQKGLQSTGASLQDILYEESVDENKIIFFTVNDALSVGYMSKTNKGWVWSRNTPFYDFQSTAKPLPSYMAGGTEINTPNNKTYFLAMGKIFNHNITKLTIDSDKINAIIIKKHGSTFWFKLLDNDTLNKNIKIYDKDGIELNR